MTKLFDKDKVLLYHHLELLTIMNSFFVTVTVLYVLLSVFYHPLESLIDMLSFFITLICTVLYVKCFFKYGNENVFS